jgi:LysR family glycine cleavage system transcriptional activator
LVKNKKNLGCQLKNLPPLNALRAFEVAARTGSFVQAGVELGVTAAAVSLQVKTLEEHLDKRLFQREGNRIVLTDAGRELYPRLGQALSEIAELAADLRGGQDRKRLVVSVLPSLADLWLVPKLRNYEGPTALELRVEDDPVVLPRAGVDLRITYGAHFYPDYRVETLGRDQVLALAAPGKFAGFPDLPGGAFIHTDWGPAYATQPSWQLWARRNGFPAPDLHLGLRVGTSALALAAARAGLGIALAPESMAREDLATGRLIALPGEPLEMSHDYLLVYANASASRRALQALIVHLRSP